MVREAETTGRQIRLLVIVDGRRNGHDQKPGFPETGRIGGKIDPRRAEFLAAQFAGGVDAPPEFFDLFTR